MCGNLRFFKSQGPELLFEFTSLGQILVGICSNRRSLRSVKFVWGWVKKYRVLGSDLQLVDLGWTKCPLFKKMFASISS